MSKYFKMFEIHSMIKVWVTFNFYSDHNVIMKTCE